MKDDRLQKRGAGLGKRAVSVAAALALTLGVVPMSGCSWEMVSEVVDSLQQAGIEVPDVSELEALAQMALTGAPVNVYDPEGYTDYAEEATEAAEATDPWPGVPAEDIDMSEWTTLGDALAVASESPSYAYDDQYFTCLITAGDAYYRVVAEVSPAVDEAMMDLDFGDPDFEAKFMEVIGTLPLASAEDITAGAIDQETLDTFVGMTGQDLVDAGFVFEFYNMYSGAETGADFGYGYFAYDVTFDVSVPESATEDEGASLLGATVTEVRPMGFSDLAFAMVP